MTTKAMHALIGKICLKMSCSVRNGALDLLCILEFTGKAGCSVGAEANSRALKR